MLTWQLFIDSGRRRLRALIHKATRSSWFRNPRQRIDVLTAMLMLAPSLLIFGAFVYLPLGFNFYLSTTSWNFLSPTKACVGLQNYQRMFADHRFWRVVTNTLGYSAATVTLPS